MGKCPSCGYWRVNTGQRCVECGRVNMEKEIPDTSSFKKRALQIAAILGIVFALVLISTLR